MTITEYIHYYSASCLSHSTSYIWDSSMLVYAPLVLSLLFVIPVYEYTAVYLSVLMMNIWGVFV